MEPDISIEQARAPRSIPIPVIILDAKYRVDDQINNAITSIHTYRDALVETVGKEEHKRTVKAALVLVPKVPYRCDGDWKTLPTPQVFFREEYRGRFRFGALVMRPGIEIDECRRLLEKTLSYIEQQNELVS